VKVEKGPTARCSLEEVTLKDRNGRCREDVKIDVAERHHIPG
jgi:hypothetical protein